MIVTQTKREGSRSWLEIDVAQSSPDGYRFGIPLYHIELKYMEQAKTIGLVGIRPIVGSFMTEMAQRGLGAWMLQRYETFRAGWWDIARTLWRAGLIEAPPETMTGSIRFRPFPWKGMKRRYKLSKGAQ